MTRSTAVLGFVLLLMSAADAQNPARWEDPAALPPVPAHAVGFPSRAADLDVLLGFEKPPAGYGEVGFYWWLGDPLTKERLAWQLDQLKLVDGVEALQINYAHSDRGGRSYGLTYPSEPALFSQKWWELFGWFVVECQKRGMAVSLSDYTLGVPGQGFWTDEMIAENPGLRGSILKSASRDAAGGAEVKWTLNEGLISAMAYRVADGAIDPASAVDLRASVKERELIWRAPAGNWRIIAIHADTVALSVDPMNPLAGRKYVEKFFQRFEDRAPGQAGKGLNFFFSDELDLGVRGKIWNAAFAEEFKKRKGYDIVPELPALFADIGPRTPKIRLDYSDVLVSLSEEHFFKPLFDWHYSRGMIFGCDHGGRGRDVVEFGDYFRTQRWMTGPGCDQPGLGSNITKNKVAASIAHLYQRPRVWLEGYYGSGWGTSTEQLTQATFRNFAMGHNLLTLHGLYYSTRGGYWEWAPPCNHFRMPYWAHMKEFLACSKRLSYLMSQGTHRCDVAILYPVAPMEAGMAGQESVRAAFGLGDHLYNLGIDFDYMDHQSLERAAIEQKELRVSGEAYRVLVLPAMQAVRHSTLEKAWAFARQGGIVVVLGAPPQASDRAGRDDPQLRRLVDALQVRLTKNEEVSELVTRSFPRDFDCAPDAKGHRPAVQHRRIGPRDVYMVHGAEKGVEATFRAIGRVEIWDPWTGAKRSLPVISQNEGVTRLRMPLSASEAQIIVFSPGEAQIEQPANTIKPTIVAMDGEWEFELKPTMYNKFGDYRLPAFDGYIGAEARQFRYMDETEANANWSDPKLDDSKWQKVTAGFGPRFWRLGPMPAKSDSAKLEAQLAAMAEIDPAKPLTIEGKTYRWEPYSFSWQWGIEGDPGHQGYHGLKGDMHEEFIGLGKLVNTATSTRYDPPAEGTRYYLWSSIHAPGETAARVLSGPLRPAAIWMSGQKIETQVKLRAGSNPLLLRYDAPGRTWFVVAQGETPWAAKSDEAAFSDRAKWIWIAGDNDQRAERFFRRRTELPAAPTKALLRITCDNGYTAYVNGRQIGSGNAWARVQELDVRRLLAGGQNLLAVRARNDGGEAGLIAELIVVVNGKEMRIGTDDRWVCAPTEVSKWSETAFDDSSWKAAAIVSTFNDSLWAKHPQGPPRLDAPAVAEAAAPSWPPVLSSPWPSRAGVLQFDTRPQAAVPAGWYRFSSAPGLRGMSMVVRGKVRAWVDGAEVAVEHGKRRADGAAEAKVSLRQPQSRNVSVALRVEQQRGDYAGAAFPEPISLVCGEGSIAAGDWSQIDGLRCYSGGAWYRKTITLTADQLKGNVELDLGKVVSSAEVVVNGQRAGVRVAAPWTFDVTSMLKVGENRIGILVYNTLGNHYITIPTRYRGQTVSGLIGPVELRCGQ